jgi:hypothetical protein
MALAHASEPVPFSSISADMLGDTLSNAAVHSPVGPLIVAGYTYKMANLASDIGGAAIDKEDRFLGAEMIVVNQDCARLRKIGADGGDLNGKEANAIKAELQNTKYQMTVDQRSPYGYTLGTVVKNLPFAVKKVAFDKVLEQTIGGVLHAAHIDKLFEAIFPAPENINWMLNYGGPLEDLQKGLGWGKLGTRARIAEKAAAKSMKSQEAKAVADFLGADREESLEESAERALGKIYQRIIAENPSQPRTVVVQQYRLVAAREAVMLPAPAAEVPVMVATPTMAAERPDPVIRAIQADDAQIRHFSTNAPQRSNNFSNPPRVYRPAPVTPSVVQEDAATVARWQAFHDQLKIIGDGKTFTLCSNGCPPSSNSSWDGRRGQTLTNGK